MKLKNKNLPTTAHEAPLLDFVGFMLVFHVKNLS
jgi:hypothetical protein